MNIRSNRLIGRFLSNRGYTIDQTILIVAIIAILITLIIVTVGWQLINRSSGTKAGAQLKQVEDANGQFFSSQRVWPHQALTATATGTTNMRVLANSGFAASDWNTNINQGDLKNLVPGFKLLGSDVYHGFGSGGIITEQANKYLSSMNIGTDTRMVVQFAGTPISEAREADRAIDGIEGYNVGRVIYSPNACLNATVAGSVTAPASQATTGTVYMCYAANTVE